MNTYRASQNTWQKKRRAEHRAWAKELLGGKCVHCGSTERLEFDHIDPSTMKFRIATYVNMNKEFLLPELKKCQLLCRPCHQKKTAVEIKNSPIRASRYYPPAKHGLASTYSNKRCRCNPCKKAWREYYSARQYRKKLVVAV